MKKYIILIFYFLSWLTVSNSFAMRVDSIYQANVPLASQNAADRLQAERQALLLVLAKVSGNSHVFENADIKEGLKSADSLVDEFSYSQSPQTPATPYILNVKFDDHGVNRVLRNADIRIWGRNRPEIMVWIAYEEPKQQAVIIESSSSNPIQGVLRQYSEQRGLPMLLPAMDITDVNRVGVNDVTNMTMPILQTASKRYTSEAMLIINVSKIDDGYSIRSKMVVKNKETDWNITGKKLEDVVAILTNNVADTLAGRYAGSVVTPAQTQLTLKVTGVTEEGDLGDVIKYVNHLASVSDVSPIRIDGSDVLLKVVLRSGKDEFKQALSEGQKMFPIDDLDDSIIHYQWAHS